MEEKLSVELKNLISIFSSDPNNENFYQVPNYQRPYSWNKENISELLDDLFTAYVNSREEEYFCGSIVLVENKNDERNDIIDGQQRFTTFTIFICFIKSLYFNQLSNKNKDIINEAIHDRYENSKFRLRFRTDDKNENDYEQSIVLKDRIQFDESIKENQIEKKIKNNRYLQNAYFIKCFFENLSSRPENLDINDFVDFLMNKVVFTVIKSKDTSNAIRIFNVLNDRGMPLSSIDILKSNLMTSLNIEDRKTFKAKWDSINEKVNHRFDFEDMLQSYLYYKIASNPHKRIDEELLEIYKKEKVDSLSAINEISKFADSYLDIMEAADKYIYILKYLRHSIYWTTILSTARFLNYSDFEQLKKILAAYYFQNWIAGATIARIKQTSLNIISEIKKKSPVEKIRNLLKSNLEKYKTTQDYRSNLESENVYHFNWCKSVLFVCEYFSTDNDNFNFLPLDKNIWIEHILPETVNSDSPWRKDFTQEEIDELTHCIGNLTPLSLRKNIQAQNYSFEKKKEAYGKKDNIATSFYITQQVLAEESWTPDKVRMRKSAVVSKLSKIFEL
ncbi:DUF262 domain-containing protein [Treponema sp.]|uniref:DUF262 domain-containing protein n=1 Tax=Treponema sp. TaxID=166 RepID=UPI003F04FA79